MSKTHSLFMYSTAQLYVDGLNAVSLWWAHPNRADRPAHSGCLIIPSCEVKTGFPAAEPVKSAMSPPSGRVIYNLILDSNEFDTLVCWVNIIIPQGIYMRPQRNAKRLLIVWR